MNKHLLPLLCFTAVLLPAQDDKPKVDLAKTRAAAEAAFNKQEYDAAAAGYRQVTEADPKDADAWFRLGFALHSANKLDEALAAHEKAASFQGRTAGTAAYNAACVYSLKGNKDKAFEWLDKAATLGFVNADHMDTDTDMDPIRKDARYEKAVAKIKAAAAGRGAGGFMVIAQPAQNRKGTRIVAFGQTSAPALAIDYAELNWKDTNDAALASPKMAGKKWRFGKDFWTNLDSSMDVEIGGTAVPAGHYYLTLEKRTAEAGDVFVLALHNAAEVKKLKLDAYQAEKLQGGIEVKLQYSKSVEIAKQLEIGLKMEQGSQENGSLQVRFGPHALQAPLKIKLK